MKYRNKVPASTNRWSSIVMRVYQRVSCTSFMTYSFRYKCQNGSPGGTLHVCDCRSHDDKLNIILKCHISFKRNTQRKNLFKTLDNDVQKINIKNNL